MAEHICDICIHEQACAAWVRHCTVLYEDFRYSTDNCPYFQVRCRDCKYWHEAQSWCDQHSYFIGCDGVSCSPAESPSWTMWDADDFCSDGERRDSDG